MHDNPATAYVIHYTMLDSKDAFSCGKEEEKKVRKRKNKALRLKKETDIGFNSSIRERFLISWFIHH